jgi:hypothetical protein
MFGSLIFISLAVGFVFFVKSFTDRRKRNPRNLPLPPGPKGLPLLGNMLQFPQVLPWEGYAKLCEEYGKLSVFQCYRALLKPASAGDMIYLKAPGQGILVLGSKRRVVDLLDKRATNYSDRPAFPITEL